MYIKSLPFGFNAMPFLLLALFLTLRKEHCLAHPFVMDTCRNLREARDLAISERDRAIGTEREVTTKYEQLMTE